jgi:branched-chain amino acid transport system substrate-binding protein
MKKIALLLTAVIVSIAVFAGCTPSAGNSDTIKIGVNYELSGDVATYGQSSVHGIELAI